MQMGRRNAARSPHTARCCGSCCWLHEKGPWRGTWHDRYRWRGGRAKRSGSVWARIRRDRWMYLFILPGFLYFVVFRYLPLLGNIIAFQDYSPFLGFTARGSASPTSTSSSPIRMSASRSGTRGDQRPATDLLLPRADHPRPPAEQHDQRACQAADAERPLPAALHQLGDHHRALAADLRRRGLHQSGPAQWRARHASTS